MRFGISSMARSLRRLRVSSFLLKNESKKSMVLLILISVCTLYSLLFINFKNADKQNCDAIYMYPSYAKLNGINSHKETRFADKYHLYLYREQGLDKDPMNSNDEIQIDGIPVLFIPGNAGSYKQGRSIAAQLSNYYYEKDYLNFEEINKKYEYMQYDSSINSTTTKRSLLDYFFDNGDRKSRYNNIDFFVLDFNEDFTAFHGQTMLDQAEFSLANNKEYGPLPESVMIVGHSMGGIVSRTIPILKNYIPNSVNTIITLSSPHGTSPLTFDGELLKIYKMINDFWIKEMNDKESYYYNNVSLISITGGIADDILPSDYTLVEPLLNSEIPMHNGFTVYTSGIENVWTTIDHLAVVWCDQLRKVVANSIMSIVDRSSATKTISLKHRMNFFRSIYLDNDEYENFSINNNMTEKYVTDKKFTNFKTSLKFTGDSILPDSFTKKGIYNIDLSTFEQSDNFNLNIKIDEESLSEVDIYLCDVDDRCTVINNLFKTIPVAASSENKIIFINRFVTNKNIKLSFFRLFFGQKLKINKNLNIQQFNLLSKLTSSLALKLTIKKTNNPLEFGSYIKQSLKQPYESKWHSLQFLESKHISITSANNPPFLPTRHFNKNAHTNFHLTLDNTDHVIKSMTLSIDFGLTFKLLIKTYRLAFASIPVGLAAIIFAVYPSLADTSRNLMNYVTYYGMGMCFLIEALALVSGSRYVLENWMDCIKVNDNLFNDAYSNNQKNEFLGNKGLGFDVLFIDYIVLMLSLALVVIVTYLINGIEWLVSKLKGNSKVEYKSIKEKTLVNHKNKFQVFKSLITFGRILKLIVMVVAVVMYVPYNIIYVVLVISHILYTIKLFSTETCKSPRLEFNKSILLLMLLIVPISVPIVVVFFHNFAVNWKTAFRSHHNFLAVLPIMGLEFSLQSNLMISREKSIFSRVASVTLCYLIFFSFFFGVRNTYFIYHIFNLLSCSLIMMLL
ncbi:hypothetical protein ACO0OE_000555 [Hanseniaspora uvarum]